MHDYIYKTYKLFKLPKFYDNDSNFSHESIFKFLKDFKLPNDVGS